MQAAIFIEDEIILRKLRKIENNKILRLQLPLEVYGERCARRQHRKTLLPIRQM